MDVGYSHEAALSEWSCLYACVGLQSVTTQRIEWPHPEQHREIEIAFLFVSRMGSKNDHTRAKQAW